MKLTKSKLKEIIREELLKEGMNIKEAAGSSFASNSRLQAMVQTLNNAINDFEKDYNETAQGNDYIKSNKKVLQLLQKVKGFKKNIDNEVKKIIKSSPK